MWNRYEVVQFSCLAVVALTGLLMLSTLFSTSQKPIIRSIAGCSRSMLSTSRAIHQTDRDIPI